ncbi:MAG: alpha-glucan family phosphorylase [Sphingobacteriia bacterium]|nr:alpha-glucan family phosphorylase [Sphingobacteriia bacterium]
MNEERSLKPNYVFETSWEICNMIGGIYTVLSTKAPLMKEEFGDQYITIGPDVWKETKKNPSFTEDKSLFADWREVAFQSGLFVRIGRWNIESNPIAILIDFTNLFPEKDKIFAKLWERYQLDSISGQWDYIEPAMFGYAVGKVIESFYNHYLYYTDRIVAHFHEWMTGSGILYLNEFLPQVATTFTTHATTIGRSISGNGLPLYGKINEYDGEEMARKLGIVSRFSLEKKSALNADAFSTVSAITAIETDKLLKKKADVITPNGFSSSLFLSEKEFKIKRQIARQRIKEVTEALFNKKIEENAFFTITSGRYEFRNKGINLFINATGKVISDNPDRQVVAFVKIPANHTGPRNELLERLAAPDFKHPTSGEFLTHGLYHPDHDAILKEIKNSGFTNEPSSKVMIVFVPAYLNGDDGIFNLSYYDLLPGFDLSVFPSYYEPWGYTPLESVAFRVPTVTTLQAGFGQWVNDEFPEEHPSVYVINRPDDDDVQVVNNLSRIVREVMTFSEEKLERIRENASSIARKTDWQDFIRYYSDLYEIALGKVANRVETFPMKAPVKRKIKLTETQYQDAPVWKRVVIEPKIPEKLKGLHEISLNLWWSWNFKATDMFETIDPEKWKAVGQNPIALLDSLSIEQWRKLENDKVFYEKYTETYEKFKNYMAEAKNRPDARIAYFSMEYGLHQSLKIYSGGLGVLAGDYLKEASDSNENIVAVGIIYKYGYFQQSISAFGDQVAEYLPQKFSQLPLERVMDDEGKQMQIRIGLPGRILYVRVWRCNVGRIPLYLLDTDFSDNEENDKKITHQLYGGDSENRLKQEIVLGVGGIRMLYALGIQPTIYHSNEGHSAFIGLERLRYLIQQEKLSYLQALEIVRSSTLFTTHTPVPAGHDVFSEDLLRTYFPHYPERLNLTWEEFMNLGKFIENEHDSKFSMSVLAAKLSQEINGVSRIHGRVSQEMFAKLYDGYYPSELHIGYVTNGVHLPTWASKPWKQLYKKIFGEDYKQKQTNFDMWKLIHEVDDKTVWDSRKKLKKELITYLKVRLREEMTRRQENPKLILDTIESLDDQALTIGFARRFATYKRAKLLFSNLERLENLVNISGKPIQFIYAGKAHPNDTQGQELIKKIIEISKAKAFTGKIIFVENYDLELAHTLIPGVDVWLNTPTRPLEASGTSGEKAVMNGVVNFSVLDGWWAEGFKEGAGFAIEEARTYANQQFQDELDAEIMYNVFEDHILPLYYDTDKDGIPVRWIQYIKNTVSDIAPHFTMKRMLEDYQQKFYSKLIKRTVMIGKNNYKPADDYARWKQEIKSKWHEIKLEKLMISDSNNKIYLEDNFSAEVTLYTNGISPKHLGVEIIFSVKDISGVRKILFTREMIPLEVINSHARYSVDIPLSHAGTFNYGFRVFPKHELVPHRQDFSLVKWI